MRNLRLSKRLFGIPHRNAMPSTHHMHRRCSTHTARCQREDYDATQNEWYFIKVKDCEGCTIKGGGTVNGRAADWVVDR